MSRKQFSVGILITLIIFALLLLSNVLRGNNERDAQVARGLVESAYQTVSSGSTDDLPEHRKWEAISQKYGRVLRWRITGMRRGFLYKDWLFDVEVTRERALTREQVNATAGPSRAYGFYSPITDVRVESARLLPKT